MIFREARFAKKLASERVVLVPARTDVDGPYRTIAVPSPPLEPKDRIVIGEGGHYRLRSEVGFVRADFVSDDQFQEQILREVLKQQKRMLAFWRMVVISFVFTMSTLGFGLLWYMLHWSER